jgi:uncharacterized protein YfiM (DUF2279 family)
MMAKKWHCGNIIADRIAYTGAVLVLLMLLPGFAQARCITDDAWTGRDKAKHAAVGFVIGTAGTLTTGDPLQGFAIGVGVGILKELSDSRHPKTHTCSLQDLAATAAGAAIGASFGGVVLSYSRGETRVSYARAF